MNELVEPVKIDHAIKQLEARASALLAKAAVFPEMLDRARGPLRTLRLLRKLKRLGAELYAAKWRSDPSVLSQLKRGNHPIPRPCMPLYGAVASAYPPDRLYLYFHNANGSLYIDIPNTKQYAVFVGEAAEPLILYEGGEKELRPEEISAVNSYLRTLSKYQRIKPLPDRQLKATTAYLFDETWSQLYFPIQLFSEYSYLFRRKTAEELEEEKARKEAREKDFRKKAEMLEALASRKTPAFTYEDSAVYEFRPHELKGVLDQRLINFASMVSDTIYYARQPSYHYFYHTGVNRAYHSLALLKAVKYADMNGVPVHIVAPDSLFFGPKGRSFIALEFLDRDVLYVKPTKHAPVPLAKIRRTPRRVVVVNP